MLRTDFNNVTVGSFSKPPHALQGQALTDRQPYRLVATAIDGNPRNAKGEIFAVGDAEYLVPEEKGYDGAGQLTSYVARIDLAKKIVSRPNGTRQIQEMIFSDVIPASDRTVLEQAVDEENPPQQGYTTQIIRHQL